MDDVLRTLIPVIGVSIPLVVVAGRFIVQPIVTAMTRMHAQSDQRALVPLQQQLEATEQRLAMLERQIGRVIEEQEFQRNLLSGRPSRTTVDAG